MYKNKKYGLTNGGGFRYNHDVVLREKKLNYNPYFSVYFMMGVLICLYMILHFSMWDFTQLHNILFFVLFGLMIAFMIMVSVKGLKIKKG